MDELRHVDVRDSDVIDFLVADHREVEETLDQIWQTTDPRVQRDLADLAISQLVRHSVAEETIVYPAMREHLPDGDKEVEHDLDEHRELLEIMKALEGLDAASPLFVESVKSLQDKLKHHIEDEETGQFQQLREAVPRQKLVRMAVETELLKKVAPTRPHPSAPQTPLFHLTVGTGVGLVDRLRDALTQRVTG